jgi:hypothetical protein
MSYLSTVLADAPVHYWRLSEPGSFIAHDIGSATPYHLLGGVTPIGGFTGIANDGGSFFFGGALPLLNQDTLTQATPVTIELWVWPMYTLTVAAGEQVIGWDGDGAPELQVVRLASGAYTASASGMPGITDIARTPQRWRHLVYRVSPASAQFYVDGASVGNSVGATATISRIFAIGADGNRAFGANMFACECAIYNTALSSARVAAHFAAQEITHPPVQLQLGTLNLVTGGTTFDSVSIAAILAAVRRTFPTT